MDGLVRGWMFLIFVLHSPIRAVNKLQIIFTDQTHHITKGSEVRLTCVVNGGDNPHVTWISPNGQLLSNAMTEHNGQTLVISGFDTINSGQYICVASDGVQFANHVFTVTISSAVNVTQTTLKHTTSWPERTSSVIQATTTTTQHVATQTSTTQRTTTAEQHVTATTTSVASSKIPSSSMSPTTPRPTKVTRPIVLSTLPNVHGPSQTTGLYCMMCQDVVSPSLCSHSVKCGAHEECYLEMFLRNGRVLYTQGCRSKLVCSSQGEVFGRRRQSDSIALCESCCSDYNRCNLGGLCHTPGVSPKVFDLSVLPSVIHLGDLVEVSCKAMGVPKPSIQWSILASSYPDNLRFVEDSGASILKILNFTPNNEHQYRCTAKNINGEDSKIVTLRVG